MFDSFYFHKFIFRISPTSVTEMPGWVGAVLRNNFLYAAENIAAGKNASLRKVIDYVQIPEDHPLFRELNGAPPKCFYIAPCPAVVSLLERQHGCINPDQWLEFSISIFGRYEIYIPSVIEAVEYMCKRGFGHPMVPFSLTGVRTVLPDGSIIPYHEQNHCAVRMNDHRGVEQTDPRRRLILSLDTPTEVINVNNALDGNGLSYCDLTSAFPSFYLIAKTSLSRLEKLNTIYCDPDPVSHYSREHEMMLDFLRSQCRCITLSSADIIWMQADSTPKKGHHDVIPLGGYVGRLAFSGCYAPFLPFLSIAQHIGIGRNIAYGNGAFRIFI